MPSFFSFFLFFWASCWRCPGFWVCTFWLGFLFAFLGRRNTLFSVFRDRNILVCQVQPAIGKPRPLRGKKKPFSRGSSHFLRERKPRTHTYTPAPMSRLSLTIHSVGTSHARSWAEMKVEGEEGRGSVKVPFITATRALPPSASGCRARNRYDVRCCASLAVGMFAKRSWSWYGCPDIYQRQRFQDEGDCLASIAQSQMRRYRRKYAKSKFLVRTRWSLPVHHSYATLI